MARKYLGGSGRSLQFAISFAASNILVFYGYDQGVFGNILVSDDFLQTMGNPSTALQGNMTSVYNLGCFAGALSAIWLGDKLGRPRMLLLGSTTIALGAIIQTACYSPGQMIVGRVIAGIGTGMNTATAGIWQAETSRMDSRGKLITIQMASCIFGVLVSNFLTLGFSFANGSVAWRFPLAFQIFFTIVTWCTCPFLPDSPRLLLRKGRHEETLNVLAALEGDNATPSSPSVQAQYRIIKDVLEVENSGSHRRHQVIMGKGPNKILRRLILGAWMFAMTQLSGINITSYYMTYVFVNALNFSVLRSRILSACGSVVYLIFSLLAYFVIERWGRRWTIIVSAAGCTICWIVIAATQGLVVSNPVSTTAYNVASVVFFFIFWAAFGIGLLPVPWTYPTEINSIQCRTLGAAIGVSTNWIMNYMVAEVTPIGIENLKWQFWVIWAVICASFVPIVYLFYPETSGRSLEDIDRYFQTNPGFFVFKDKDAISTKRPRVYEDEDADIIQTEQKRAETLVES